MAISLMNMKVPVPPSANPAAEIEALFQLPAQQQAIYLSLAGETAWRMYRQQHLPATLLLEMYGASLADRRDIFLTNAYDLLNRFVKISTYDKLGFALLEEFAQAQVLANVRGMPYHVADGDRGRALMLGQDTLWERYRINPYDRRVLMVNGLATLMRGLTNLHLTNSSPYEALIEVWFKICDAALGDNQ